MLLKKNRGLIGLYVVFIAVYILQTLLAPVDKATLDKYQISSTNLRLLTLTIAIPYIVIWLVALVGYLRLKTYAQLIEKDEDGQAFQTISKGVLWLSLWLPLSTIITNLFSQYYHSHHAATADLVRLDNYLNLAVLFAAFLLVYLGASKLLNLIKQPAFSMSQTITLVYIAFSGAYVWLVLQDPARFFPAKSVPVASYYERDWLIVFTLVIPRLIYWFLGIQAARSIYLYRKKVKGTLYKQALTYLSEGLVAVVVMTVVLRCLQSLSSPLARLNLGFLLVIVYLLLILISVGYGLIAKGTKNLQQLEEL